MLSPVPLFWSGNIQCRLYTVQCTLEVYTLKFIFYKGLQLRVTLSLTQDNDFGLLHSVTTVKIEGFVEMDWMKFSY